VEAAAGTNRLLVDVLLERDDSVLRKLADADIHVSTLRAIEHFLENDRKSRLASGDVDNIIGFSDGVALEGMLSVAIPESRKRIEALTERRVELLREVERATRVLSAIPEADALVPLHRAREEAREAEQRATAAHKVARMVLDVATADRVKASADHEKALDQAAYANLAADDDQRLLHHVDRVRATLESLRIASTRQHLARISQLILEALGMLLRKEKLVTDVQIDPVTHTVALTGVDGHALLAEDLSAGERQLLAVALLWGLARAAGQPLPVVIDTPLGRLDSSHREHLLERYFPQASHQVVLLSTDTEINREAFERIAPWIGRSHRLEFDPDTSATHVEDGYFWE
jgi:DNA sulfur modification protein DndD